MTFFLTSQKIFAGLMGEISARGKNGKKKIKGEKKRGKVLSAEARGARDCFEKVLILEGKGDQI